MDRERRPPTEGPLFAEGLPRRIEGLTKEEHAPTRVGLRIERYTPARERAERLTG
jgi:hypothetical protein